jgi:hypothetical protein
MKPERNLVKVRVQEFRCVKVISSAALLIFAIKLEHNGQTQLGNCAFERTPGSSSFKASGRACRRIAKIDS